MTNDKTFLTYNQQMKKLRNTKKIKCNGSLNKEMLVRSGYFNIINGYKMPFTCGIDSNGNHIYYGNTSLDQINHLKKFDESLRMVLLKQITRIEEEVRTLTGYKFDQYNNNGKTPWYEIDAYSEKSDLKSKIHIISSIFSDLKHTKSEYVDFYVNRHKQIPTWIMIKVVNFSTFIDILKFSHNNVTHAICDLYSMYDAKNMPDVKLLIGSLHWLRIVRNSCAHNERIYCINITNSNNNRIIERYFKSLPPQYAKSTQKNIFDILVYFKYFLPENEFISLIADIKELLLKLKLDINPNAFDNVRSTMGIKNLTDLDTLVNLPKSKIDYNKFDTM